jgi:hypothetical protein
LEWKFDKLSGNTAYDTSGNGNDGQLGLLATQSSSSPAHTVLGKKGNALSFDGTNDYVISSQNESFTQYTASAWVKMDTYKPSDERVVVTMADTVNSVFMMKITDGGGIVHNVRKSNCSTLQQNYSGGNHVPLGEWTYVTVTFDGTDAKAYANGVLADDDPLSDTLCTDSRPFYAGRRYWTTPAEFMDGLIDDIRIYDYARTPAQIAWDYNRGKPVGHWEFDECQGETAYDKSAHDNDGSIIIGGSGDNTATGTCAEVDSNAAWYNGRDGRINSALSFDGTDDYVDLGDVGDKSANMTISAWVYADAFPNYLHTIVGKEGSTGAVQTFVLRVDDTPSGHVEFSIWQSNDVEINMGSNSYINTGQWHHVTATYNSSGIQKIYIDGTLDATQSTADGTLQDTNTTTKISRSCETCGNPDREWDGLLDDVRIYNYELTEEQIKQVYNDGAAVRFTD